MSGQVVNDQFGVGKRTVQAVAAVNEAGQIIGSSSAPATVTPGQVAAITATIASGASISNDLDLGLMRLGRIAMPADWTAANITLQVSHNGSAWNNLFDQAGSEYSIVAAAGRSNLIPLSDMLSVRYLRLRSGTSAAPVNQAAARSITLILVP